ncbi:MAG: ABC transporter ATP-binding protein [Proteobacteria bacterium]|nr:ABC transporter ATP-binding protein [Pseudomonadota bacterium]
MKPNNTAIRVNNISKCYRIGLKEQIHENIATAFLSLISSPLSNYRKYRSLYKFKEIDFDNNNGSHPDLIWALKNVSFDVNQGESLGIIGKNGSGKSTLLKILSKITVPTKGRAEIHGRVSSLLEVGTGFHPELTGRENIYLNGTVLGMRKHEINKKFDEIVDFSGIEKFIETPVKRYSSGMKVRLAFSVAAHLEPEILLVDEVLAVGDAEFQKKCLGKMGDVTKEGRTVLFVSHNMAAMEQLCERVVWLNKGALVGSGPARDMINQYLDMASPNSLGPDGDLSRIPREPSFETIFINGELNGLPFKEHHLIHPLAPLTIKLKLNLSEAMTGCGFGIHLTTNSGQCVYAANTRWNYGKIDFPEKGIYEFECTFDKLPLVPDKYYLALGMRNQVRQIDWMERVLCIEVSRDDVYGTMEFPEKSQGFFLTQANWKIDNKVTKRF